MMIRADEYPQVERHAGNHVTQRRPPDAARVRPRQAAQSPALPKLTYMSGALPGIRFFGDANYFSAA
jgi:hypothetical protein